jgi:cardiolipin synthase
MITPILGTAFYGFMQTQLGTAFLKKRLAYLNKSTKPYMLQNKEVLEDLRVSKPANANLATYMTNQISFPVHRNTSVKYFASGEEKFEELKSQLRKAEDYIFMEYFIVEKGVMWNEILDILKEKVWQGVDVRVMYDGMCSLYLLPADYDKELRRAGIKCRQFNKVQPVLTSYQNNRAHRKICVIDGKVAFTGGINLADEYINVKERFGHWKDTAIMVEGEAVQSFTMMFLEMWNITVKREESYERYLTPKSDVMKRELGYIIPYADSPYDNQNVGEQVYLHILDHAKKYVHIMTPYLIIDDDLLSAFEYVAQCGIEIIIIMPHIPDKWYAFAVARTYYESLMKAGVQIYEYTPGFVHAKVFVSDDDTATVGTVNLDYRSLYHHFECGAFIYNNPVVWDIEKDFQETLQKCHKMTMQDLKNRSWFEKLSGKILRLIAPLM